MRGSLTSRSLPPLCPPLPPPPPSPLPRPAADAQCAAAIAAYHAAVPALLSAKAPLPDEAFAIQYVPGVADAPGAPAPAALSARYLGRPVLDAEKRQARAFEFCARLPRFLSRIAGTRLVRGGGVSGSGSGSSSSSSSSSAGASSSSSSASASAAAAAAAAAASSAAATAAAAASALRTVLVLGDESLEVEAVPAPSDLQLDAWIAHNAPVTLPGAAAAGGAAAAAPSTVAVSAAVTVAAMAP